MVELSTKSHPLFARWDEYRKLLDALGPAELSHRREAALDRFDARGIPTTRDEEFRYLPLNALNDRTYAFPVLANVSRRELEALTLDGIDATVVVVVNGVYAPELGDEAIGAEGVTIETLDEIVQSNGDWSSFGTVATLDGKLGSTNDERFADLNLAMFSDAIVVRVASGAAIERPIHIRFITASDKPMATFPRVLIELADGATAKVVESYGSLRAGGFTCGVTEIRLGRGANLEHVRVQDEVLDAVHVGAMYVHQTGDSVFSSNNLQFGSESGRVDVNVWLDGEHTETWLNGVYIGQGDQTLDNHTRIDHAKPNCNSFEVYKGVLSDRSSGVFNGKIFVYEDAQKTDAKQTNQVMLLSPTANIDTKPQLEIFADDVKCTHGATVGQLREDALFYLRARGVPKAEAQALLVYAFAADVVDKITLDDVREKLEARVFQKLGD